MKLEASMDYIAVPEDQRLSCKPLRNEGMGNTFWVSCFISSRLLATEKVWAEGFLTHNCLLTRLDRGMTLNSGIEICWPCWPTLEDS